MKTADYVYEVYQCQSFTKAAQKLFVSQPALSASIKKLEKEIGVDIFDRSTTPVRLTDAGEIYVEALEKIKRIETNLAYQLNDISQLKCGHLTIGGANFIASFVIPKIIIAYTEKYPGIYVDMIESNSKELQTMLLTEDLELLVDYSFDPQVYDSYPLFQEQILLSVPTACPVNKRISTLRISWQEVCENRHFDKACPAVNLRDLEDSIFVMLKKGNDMHMRANILCGEAGFLPQVTIYLDQLMTSYNISLLGMGIAFITDTLVKATNPGQTVALYKINSQNINRTLYIAHKKNRYLSNAVKEFIHVAQSIAL